MIKTANKTEYRFMAFVFLCFFTSNYEVRNYLRPPPLLEDDPEELLLPELLLPDDDLLTLPELPEE